MFTDKIKMLPKEIMNMIFIMNPQNSRIHPDGLAMIFSAALVIN
jgi:hypothetical protein